MLIPEDLAAFEVALTLPRVGGVADVDTWCARCGNRIVPDADVCDSTDVCRDCAFTLERLARRAMPRLIAEVRQLDAELTAAHAVIAAFEAERVEGRTAAWGVEEAVDGGGLPLDAHAEQIVHMVQAATGPCTTCGASVTVDLRWIGDALRQSCFAGLSALAHGRYGRARRALLRDAALGEAIWRLTPSGLREK